MAESLVTEFDPATFNDTYKDNLIKMTRDREIFGGKVDRTAPVDEQITKDLVREALIEYRIRKGVEVAADI
jgi:hypothetical protein